MSQCVHSLGPSRFRVQFDNRAFDKRDHRVCSANASATRIASEAVFACVIFDVTPMVSPLSRRVVSDITMPPASSPLTLSAFVASAKRTRSDGVDQNAILFAQHAMSRMYIIASSTDWIVIGSRDVERRAIAGQWLRRGKTERPDEDVADETLALGSQCASS